MTDDQIPESNGEQTFDLIKTVEDAGFIERWRDTLTGKRIPERLPLKLFLQIFQEDSLFRRFYFNPLDPARLQAMIEAGELLRDTRELLGLSIEDVSVALGVKDKDVLRQVERGESTLSFDMIFRLASLLARHDPLPMILKFMRTYSPAVDNLMVKLGVDVIPKSVERERRFLNLYRQHDKLRSLSDDEYDRFFDYIDSTMKFIVDVVQTEKSIALKKALEAVPEPPESS